MNNFLSNMAVLFFLVGLVSGEVCGFQTPNQEPKLKPSVGRTSSNTYQLTNTLLQLSDVRSVPAEANGILREVVVSEGMLVQQGQVLARIDDRQANELLREATIDVDIAMERIESQLELEFAKKSKEVALADYRRGLESNREIRNIISPTEMDQLKLRVDKAEAEIKKIAFEHGLLKKTAQQKQSIMRQRQLEVEQHQIRSSIDGIVVKVNQKMGEWVNRSDKVIEIVRLNRLRIEDFLPSSLATQALVGARVRFQCKSNPEITETFRGKVVFVDPEAETMNGTNRVWIEIENPDLVLRAGMKGDLEIELSRVARNSRAK